MSDLRAEDGTPTWRCNLCGRVRRRVEFDDVMLDGQTLKVCTDAEDCDRHIREPSDVMS